MQFANKSTCIFINISIIYWILKNYDSNIIFLASKYMYKCEKKSLAIYGKNINEIKISG